jgi:hypothetical protein
MARERDRYRRDIAGVGPDPQLAGRLTRLNDMHGFDVSNGEPDIRGWEVRTLSGREVGEVEDLLVDAHRGEVVLIDIDLKDSDQHVNVPIRGVQIDRERHCVIVDSGDLRTAQDSIGYGEARVEDERALDVRPDVRPDENTDEVVVDRRPVIEEVVIRRRVIDADDADESDEAR